MSSSLSFGPIVGIVCILFGLTHPNLRLTVYTGGGMVLCVISALWENCQTPKITVDLPGNCPSEHWTGLLTKGWTVNTEAMHCCDQISSFSM